MKMTLKELELAIPTIDLLESRKIIGGYDGELGDSIYPDDGWWHGSPGEEKDPYEIPDVVALAPEMPEYGDDPRENEQMGQEESETYQGEDGHDNEIRTGDTAVRRNFTIKSLLSTKNGQG